MERDQVLYHRALVAVIAAAYRVLATWDQALSLGVAERRSERDERDTDGVEEEDTTDA